MAPGHERCPFIELMLQQHRETEMTELDERIAVERERAELLKKQMACGCPDRCDIDHDN